MTVKRIDHFTILTDDLAATVAFYETFLNLHPGPRPAFRFEGAWLYAQGGDQALLHVIAGQPATRLVPGVIDHMAFHGEGLAQSVARLQADERPYELRRLPGYDTWQLFFHDPNGAKVEIDFDAAEAAPPGH